MNECTQSVGPLLPSADQHSSQSSCALLMLNIDRQKKQTTRRGYEHSTIKSRSESRISPPSPGTPEKHCLAGSVSLRSRRREVERHLKTRVVRAAMTVLAAAASQLLPKDVTARKAASPATRSICDILSTAIASSAIRLAALGDEQGSSAATAITRIWVCGWG